MRLMKRKQGGQRCIVCWGLGLSLMGCADLSNEYPTPEWSGVDATISEVDPTVVHADDVPSWPGPDPKDEVEVTNTILVVGETFDGGMKRYFGGGVLGTDTQDEHQPAIFELYNGAILENVVLGSPAADGVHCTGSCTIRNVWWEDVGEDAATFLGNTDDDVLLVEGGGARLADDKVFQHNGRGTFHIKEFHVESFGKLYRSCGNCETQVPRKVIVENVTAVTSGRTSTIVGINENYGDVAVFQGTNVIWDAFETTICQRYEGNDSGGSPGKVGDGPDGRHCYYDESTVLWYQY